MKNKFLALIIALFTVFFSLNIVSANLKVDSSTSNSVNFSWEKQDKSVYYQIFYWETKGDLKWETEATEETNFEVKGLKENTKYYFSLVWLDSGWVEVYKSSEFEFTTSAWTSNSSTFSISSAKLIENDTLRLTFSKNLDSSRIEKTELKIENSSNAWENISVKEVKEVSGDSKSIDVKLETNPNDGTEYKVVVLVIYDESGNNIKFGVDSESKFIGGAVENSNNSATEEEKINLDSAGPVEEEPKKEVTASTWTLTEKKVLTWTSGNAKDTWKNVEKISENKENLPQTWPWMILLVVLALMISGGVLFLKNKKA